MTSIKVALIPYDTDVRGKRPAAEMSRSRPCYNASRILENDARLFM